MSYDSYEMSRQDGLPSSLYFIQWGDGPSAYFAYTDCDQSITHEGVAYEPIAIGRQKIEAGGTLDRKALEVELTPKAGVVRMYAENPPSQKVGLVIRQGHYGDTDFPVVWTGVIRNVNWEPPVAKIVGEPLDTMLARPGLRRFYMYGCPHVLYREGSCNADKLRHRRVLFCDHIGANFVRFAPGWNDTTPEVKYLGGYMQWLDADGNLQTRTCRSFGANTNEIVVASTMTLDLGTPVTIYAGCARTVADCRDLHENIVNFGGQPRIPSKNPVGYVNQYY